VCVLSTLDTVSLNCLLHLASGLSWESPMAGAESITTRNLDSSLYLSSLQLLPTQDG